VVLSQRRLETEALAEAFASLCDRASRHGLLVHLEFLPWTQVRDVRAAAEIVRRAGRPNGGIMLDSWHHFRSGTPDAAIPADLVTGIQINDAPARAEADLMEETTHRRLLPGEGAIDLRALLAHLAAGGCRAPIGVEIFSDALAGRPARETARRVARACRPLLSQGR
jgi:sugar phosphate isomerase/epimerase